MQDIYPRSFEVPADTRRVPLTLSSKKGVATSMTCYLPNGEDGKPITGFSIERNADGGFELHFDHQITKTEEIVVCLAAGTTSRHSIVLTPAATAAPSE